MLKRVANEQGVIPALIETEDQTGGGSRGVKIPPAGLELDKYRSFKVSPPGADLLAR